MNKTIAIIDIGSNTIVLVVYAVKETSIEQIYYESNAAHLVHYVKDHHMSSDGIQAAKQVFISYVDYCNLHGIQEIYADITECGRNIDNVEELIQTANSCGIPNVRLLTGKEEAMCDFYGASLDSTLEDGLLIDIGGGSTELVRFTNKNKILEAISIPLGCVRLKELPADSNIPEIEISKLKQNNPLLTSTPLAIGVGGTIRACRQACAMLNKTDHSFTSNDLYDLYKGLKEEDPLYWNAVNNSVSSDRIPVLLPGLSMFIAISKAFEIEIFHNSNYGVREGFLLHYVLKRI